VPIMVDCVCGFGNNIPEDQANCPNCGMDVGPLHRIRGLDGEYERQGLRSLESQLVDTAVLQLVAAIELGGGTPERWVQLGRAYLEKGITELAVEAANQALVLDADYEPARKLTLDASLKGQSGMAHGATMPEPDSSSPPAVQVPSVPGSRSRVRLLLPIAAFLVGLVVVPVTQRFGHDANPTSQNYDLLRERVAQRISSNPAFAGTKIEVSAEPGGVHLRGSVPSTLHGQLAGEIASGVLGGNGHVASDLEVVAFAPRTENYRVQAGDSLASIAKKFYGSEKYWTRIYDVNRQRLARRRWLDIGQELTIPQEP
jgi:LysM repeat protein